MPSMADHFAGGLDRREVELRRLIGAGAGPDIHDRTGAAKRIADASRDSHIRSPIGRIVPTDDVVKLGWAEAR